MPRSKAKQLGIGGALMKRTIISLALSVMLACGAGMSAYAADSGGWQYAAGPYAGEAVSGRLVLEGGQTRTVDEALPEIQPLVSEQYGQDIEPAVYRNGEQLGGEDVVATGDTVNVPGEASPVEIVVKGDVVGNGTPGLLQVIRIAKALRGNETLTEAQSEAADANNSGKIDLGDVVFTAKLMSGETADSADGRTGASKRSSAKSRSASKSAASDQLEKFTKTVLDGTNAIRAKNGVKPALKQSEKLSEAAQVRADELAASGTLSHTRPDGSKYSTVCTVAKGLVVGENIHCNKGYPTDETADVAMEGWENSKPHLKQMLEPRYSYIGIAFAQAKDGTWYCVQLFSNGDNVLTIDSPKA